MTKLSERLYRLGAYAPALVQRERDALLEAAAALDAAEKALELVTILHRNCQRSRNSDTTFVDTRDMELLNADAVAALALVR